MGVLRGFGIVIVSVLLFVLLVAAGVFGTLNKSLTYDHVQPEVSSIANDIISTQVGAQQIVNQFTPLLQTYCQNQSQTDITRKVGNYTFTIPCNVVSLGEGAIINYSVDFLVKDFYYKDYNCTFANCFRESSVPTFLVSDYARTYWGSLYRKSILGILILFVLLFLLVEKKSNSLILTGSLMIPASLIASQLKNLGSFVAKLTLSPISNALQGTDTSTAISQIVEVFFSESTSVFLWMFITGIILIAAGIVLRLTGWGMKIMEKIENMKNKDKVQALEQKTKNLEKQVNQKNPNQNSKNNSNQNQNNNSNKNLKK